MSKRCIMILAILGNCMLHAAAQNCNTNFLGTKTLYQTPQKQGSKAPAGYQPVFINHVGRHGARHLTKEVSASYAWQLLGKADSAHMLTADGQRLWQMVTSLNKIEHGRVKNISDEGKAELKGLGNRMFENYPSVFKKPVKLDVAYTKEVRTQQSADAFLSALKGDIKDSVSVKRYNDDTDLRFYDLSPTYTAFEEKGPWMSRMDTLRRELKSDETEQQAASRWLKSGLLQKLSHEQVSRLVGDVFGFAAIAYSVQGEARQEAFAPAAVNISSAFTCNELKVLGKIDDADDYYKKAPGMDSNGIQVRIAAPLLVNFIKTSDEFISKQHVNAQLRFAHAETIAPFAALLNMKPACKKADKVMEFDKSWKAGEVIPLSANIQWIFYRKANTGNYLVKFLLNEREVQIEGVKPVQKNYYNWQAIRQYYISKLAKMDINLNSDMLQYLSNVK